MQAAAFAGFRLGLSLILAIGPQNALVLRQGLLRQHVFAVALFCAISDAILIVIGVGGFSLAADALPWLPVLLRWGGVAFLLCYGARAIYSAIFSDAALRADRGRAASLQAVIATMAAMTWLNPHVYLDTVVLLGSVSAQFPGQERGFALGAVTASFVFFFSLAYGARLLAPLFARPLAWRFLDALVGLMMWSIALTLILGG